MYICVNKSHLFCNNRIAEGPITDLLLLGDAARRLQEAALRVQTPRETSGDTIYQRR